MLYNGDKVVNPAARSPEGSPAEPGGLSASSLLNHVESRTRAEDRAQLVLAGHRLTWCNVGLMSLAELGPKSGSRHICLIIAYPGQQGPVQYKGDKCVNVEVPPPEVGSASSLPWSSNRPARMPDSPIFVSASHQIGLDTRS